MGRPGGLAAPTQPRRAAAGTPPAAAPRAPAQGGQAATSGTRGGGAAADGKGNENNRNGNASPEDARSRGAPPSRPEDPLGAPRNQTASQRGTGPPFARRAAEGMRRTPHRIRPFGPPLKAEQGGRALPRGRGAGTDAIKPKRQRFRFLPWGPKLGRVEVPSARRAPNATGSNSPAKVDPAELPFAYLARS